MAVRLECGQSAYRLLRHSSLATASHRNRPEDEWTWADGLSPPLLDLCRRDVFLSQFTGEMWWLDHCLEVPVMLG
jgi:hypothetical protein